MAARGEALPRSMVMMGGPIDTRQSPTAVNNLATKRPLWWFENHLIHVVPANYPGRGRRVYPGFLQHSGFVAMNPERHVLSHWDFYQNLVKGDLEDAESHRRFYDEYNAVLDMPAEYYLDTTRVVFQEHLLPRGAWEVAGERGDPAGTRGRARTTLEGGLAATPRPGQTRAAHAPAPPASPPAAAGAPGSIRRSAPPPPATTGPPGAPRAGARAAVEPPAPAQARRADFTSRCLASRPWPRPTARARCRVANSSSTPPTSIRASSQPASGTPLKPTVTSPASSNQRSASPVQARTGASTQASPTTMRVVATVKYAVPSGSIRMK